MIRLNSGLIRGIAALSVQIEVDIRPGIPCFDIVGLAGATVRESRERIRAALRNCGMEFPQRRITVNLAPAGIRKDGPAFDLAIALGILACQNQIPSTNLQEYLIVGELSLGGAVCAVAGVLCLGELAASEGKSLMLPLENQGEAVYSGAKRILPVQSLTEAVHFLQGRHRIPEKVPAPYTPDVLEPQLTVADGQQTAKRVLQLAAAGWHHTLFIGPPGSGKTLLARQLPFLLAPLTKAEATDVSRIYSSCGMLQAKAGLVRQRPFRSPHHSVSKAGLVGGGMNCLPGEITLAHRGVLLLDELPEFQNDALQALRQPLEQREISIMRARSRTNYPANFLLVATANPCPCGYYGGVTKECQCSEQDLRRYRRKLSGALMDRIDMVAFLQPVAGSEFQLAEKKTMTVPLATKQQLYNGQLSDQEVRQLELTSGAKATLSQAVAKIGLSARGYYKCVKIARTIATLDGSAVIDAHHASEALQYRWESQSIFR